MTFSNDLLFGVQSESRLLERYPFLESLGKDKFGDFLIKGTKISAELKSDSYDPNRYGNIIMERYSYDEKPGGPWQAHKHKCRFFIYWFVAHDVMFVFDTVQLLARLRKLIKKDGLKLFDKQNRNWTTRFFKVPISALEDLNIGMEPLKRLHEQAAKKVAKKASKK